MSEKAKELHERYQGIALTRDHKKTAQDSLLRELEIEFASTYVKVSESLLDIGCGIGYTTRQYRQLTGGKVVGLDYAENMITVANELSEGLDAIINGTLRFDYGSVIETNYNDSSFDLITSHRCLMALLDWNLQQKALLELHRILKPGGRLVLFEGTFQGIQTLNKMREVFGLEIIDATGQDSLFTLKFDEDELEKYISSFFNLEKKQGFGTYYFLSRVFYPLHISPESPEFGSNYNEIAKRIASVYPDLVDLGHLKAYVLVKK
jgi:ubiquinone/menaquinone biosynthesis C-methylase UbiE